MTADGISAHYGLLISVFAQYRGGVAAGYQTAFVLVGALGLLLILAAFLLKTQNREKADRVAMRNNNSIIADMAVDSLKYAVDES